MPAAELYISDWFRKASKLVKTTGCPWFILSAKHGLLAGNRIQKSRKQSNKHGTGVTRLSALEATPATLQVEISVRSQRIVAKLQPKQVNFQRLRTGWRIGF